MIFTCHDCPRQLAFPGSNRDRFAALFGWSAEKTGGGVALSLHLLRGGE